MTYEQMLEIAKSYCFAFNYVDNKIVLLEAKAFSNTEVNSSISSELCKHLESYFSQLLINGCL